MTKKEWDKLITEASNAFPGYMKESHDILKDMWEDKPNVKEIMCHAVMTMMQKMGEKVCDK